MKKSLGLALVIWFAMLLIPSKSHPQSVVESFWKSIFRPDINVSRPVTAPVEAVPEAAPTAPSFRTDSMQLISASKCEAYRPYVEQAKAEMEKRNELERNACQLYKGWAELWSSSNCDEQSFADAAALNCPSELGVTQYKAGVSASVLMRPSCEEIFQKWQTATNWVVASIQACDYSMFETGCRPMAEAAEDCGAWRCEQNCTLKYACDPASFKTQISVTPIYSGNPQRLQDCMNSLRRAGL